MKEEPKPVVKEEPKPAPAPVQTKPVVKEEPKPVVKEESKPEVKTEPKRVAQPAPVETRPIETKPVETKPVVKEEPKTAKEEVKTAPKQEAKAAPKKDAKPAQNKDAKPAAQKKPKSPARGVINSLDFSYNMQFGSAKSVVLKKVGHYQYTSVNPVEVNYLIGYRFNEWIALSLGTGVSYDLVNLNNLGYDISGIYNKTIEYSPLRIPVFLNMKAFMTDSKVQPMASLSVGAMSGSVKNISQDWNMTAELGLGINIKMGKRGGFYILATGELMPMPVFETGRATSSKIKGTYSSANTLAASVKMGFMF